MSDLPELTGQIRVLVVEDDIMKAHPILARFTEAGMDARYAPQGRPAADALREAKPHVIVMSDTPNDHALKLGLFIRGKAKIPIVVLAHAHTNPELWHAVSPERDSFLEPDSSPQEILERAAAKVKVAYHEQQLMISESPMESAAERLPAGWGKCQSCNYLGPRAKFTSSNPLARHAVVCPACKRSDDIVFSVS